MSESIKANLFYLASPYTKYRDGPEAAFLLIRSITARLLRAGVHCFSPIIYTHSLGVAEGINHLDTTIWYPLNRLFMPRCNGLLVARMDGWEESEGIQKEEIPYFEQAKKPIYDLDPVTLTMARREPKKPERERYDNLTDSQIRARVENFLNPQGANP